MYKYSIYSSNNRSQSIETTTVTHGARYDEIDSMYYHHSNANELTLNNRPLEILLSSNNGGSIGSISTSNDDTAHNVSARSSSDDSYLVPCRIYINLEIGVADENSEQIREQENHTDCSSESKSESSETVMKSDHHYETVTTTNIEEHVYENSIETN
ncbi:unnamed protein product [Mytilus coruscus]|uniref:Uncharacterized protein n=1 Tax=Mytilus coruscus TaxID=42192 RepID=A0A6J8AWQ9_MYTCO|nr:unnamed protein product [Mytilus coruscus]